MHGNPCKDPQKSVADGYTWIILRCYGKGNMVEMAIIELVDCNIVEKVVGVE